MSASTSPIAGLFAEFPPHSYEQWRAAAERLLKGADFDTRLRTPLAEGITLEPIYTQAQGEKLGYLKDQLPGAGSYVRGHRAAGYCERPWAVSQALVAADPRELPAVIADALARGQDELNLPLAANGIHSARQLAAAFGELSLDAVPLFLHQDHAGSRAASWLMELASRAPVAPETLRGCVAFDPIAERAISGGPSSPQAFDEQASIYRDLTTRAPSLQSLLIRADVYRDAGAHAVQELSLALGTMVATLRALGQRGVDLSDVAPRLRVVLGIGSNFFVEIAKLRAARHLFAQVLRAFGADERCGHPHLHARTIAYNKTRLDPHVNLLRGTTEALSAILGGAESIEVHPFDLRCAAPNAFSRRTARNIQLVLANECDLTRVLDPAGGSYFIEWLTDQLARRSWESLQRLEAAGGVAAALDSGSVQKELAETAGHQREALARRKQVLVGTNMYPLLEESLAAKPVLVDMQRVGASDDALPQCYLAADFEALREAAASHRAHTGEAPALLQLNLGPSRGYRARADWATGFFAVGGFSVVTPGDSATSEQALAAVAASRAPIICIVSDDARYAKELPALAVAIKAARPTSTLAIAGAAPEPETQRLWREAGIDAEVTVRTNAYELLAQLLRRAGVEL